MSIRKLYKTPTAGGLVFWEDLAEINGWRIQYNKTLDHISPLKPYRLLDNSNYLIASADSLENFDRETITELITEYSERGACITNAQIGEFITIVGSLALIAYKGYDNKKKMKNLI